MILLKSYVVPESLRGKFKETHGKIVRSYSEIDYDYKKLITIGDFVSYKAITSGVNPDMLVYDGKTKRSEKDSVRKKALDEYKMDSTVIIRNDPGTISEEAMEFFKNYKFDMRVKVFVKGEEDMLSVLAVLYAPIGSMVVYGIPDIGMTCVKVDDDIKEKARLLLNNLVLEEGL